MAFASLVTAWLVSAVFIGSREIATWSGTIFVNSAVSVFADATAQSGAFALVFYLGALHAAIGGI